MDNFLVNTDTYRRAMHGRAGSANDTSTRPRVEIRPTTPNTGLSSSRSPDSGFAEGPEISSRLSPVNSRFDSRPGRRPYERSVASDPADDVRQRPNLIRPNPPFTSASDPFLQRFNLQVRPKSVQKKRSFLPSLFTGSSASLSSLSPQDALRLSPNVRRGRRHSDTDIHCSIDFTTHDGRTAPPLVQAAQNGSGTEIEELLDQGVNIESRHERTKRTALAVACHCGNDDVVAILLSRGANPRDKDALGMTPLHLAATRGHYRVIECLLKEDVEVDAMGPDRKTPLRLATENGHIEVASLLLNERAKVNARDVSNLTALHSAARIGDDEVVSLLLRYKADIEAKDGNFMAAIHHASENNRPNIVHMLLAKKANIEALGRESMSPLALACASGSTDVVQLLLQHKASTKHKGDGDMSPLHWASYNGHSDIVDMLLDKKTSLAKVSVDTRTRDGRSPLHLAVLSDNFATAEVLLRRGASVECQCNKALRPLHYAAMSAQSPDLVQLLLGHGASTEAECGDGRRPLHYVSSAGNIMVLGLLLRRGALVDARDGSGDRALQIASARGELEVVRLLLDGGAEMRSRYSKGPSHEDSPVCIAAKHGHLSIVEEFVRRGASVRQRDEHNWQPLRYAAYHAHPEVCQYLLANGASVSGLNTPGSFGFNLTASRIGFAPDIGINEFQRQSVLMLLNDAEVREQQSVNNSAPGHYHVASPSQDSPAEKDDDGDQVTITNIHRAGGERPELPVLQRSPRQIPPPYQGRPSDNELQRQGSQQRPANTSASSPSRGTATAGMLMSDANPSFDPSSRSFSSPPVSSSFAPSMQSNVVSTPGVVSALTPSDGYDHGHPRSGVSPLALPTYDTTQHIGVATTTPTGQPYYSPHVLPPIPSPDEAIIVCDHCVALARTTTDPTCSECRQALYMYHHIMGTSYSGNFSAQSPVGPMVHELA